MPLLFQDAPRRTFQGCLLPLLRAAFRGVPESRGQEGHFHGGQPGNLLIVCFSQHLKMSSEMLFLLGFDCRIQPEGEPKIALRFSLGFHGTARQRAVRGFDLDQRKHVAQE